MPYMKKEILLADDSDTFVMYMSILLNRLGFNVIPARDGVDAIKVLSVMTPDVILLDVNMPRLDGLKTLKLVKDDEKTTAIPVVMITVESAAELMEKCRGLGCSGYLTKPVDMNALHDVLQECLYTPLGWKRKHVRVNHTARATVQCRGNRYELYTEMLSEGGVYLRKKDPLPVGCEVEVTLSVGDEQATLKGTVIYIKNLYGDKFQLPPGMAIEFRDVPPDVKADLTDYVSKLIAEDILDSQEEQVIKVNGAIRKKGNGQVLQHSHAAPFYQDSEEKIVRAKE